MPKSHDQSREDRILDEVIVDAYGDEEKAMSWYYYFRDTLEFPFTAKVCLKKRSGATEEKQVEIVEVDKRSETNLTLLLGIVEDDSERVQYISPSDIVHADTTEENLQVLNDWLYWFNLNLLANNH